MDLRQSPQYANYLSQLGWVVEKINGNYIYLKKIPLLGYFAKIQRPPHPIKPSDITNLKKKYKVFRIVVEPLSPIPDRIKQVTPYLPTKTLVIDLTPSEKEIVAGFAKDVQRAIAKLPITNFSTKGGSASGGQFSTTATQTEIVGFHQVWRRAVPWTRYVPSLKNLLALKKSFEKDCLLITNDNKCGVVFLIADKTLYYYLAWSNKKISHTADMYRLVWEGIRWGRSRGCTKFEFEGIFDDRFPNKSWLGFSHFKSRFGGQEVSYPGCYLL